MKTPLKDVDSNNLQDYQNLVNRLSVLLTKGGHRLTAQWNVTSRFRLVLLRLTIAGMPYEVIAKWDGLRNQLVHVGLHLLLAWLLTPLGSAHWAACIEVREGFVGTQLGGCDLIDLNFRLWGSLLGLALLNVLHIPTLPEILWTIVNTVVSC